MSDPFNTSRNRLPEPANEFKGVNNSDGGVFAKIAKRWQPRGTTAEPVAATVARFAHRLIDAETGEAKTADELGGESFIDVRDYPGVVGDGSNDDTAGIQLAVDAAVAAKRRLYFGPVSVRYKLTDEIIISGSLPLIFGSGMHPTSKSVVRQSVASKGAFILRHGGAGSHSYTRIEDMRIEGASNVTTASANTKAIWLDSEEISPGVESFFDEVGLNRIYMTGFTWGVLAEKCSNTVWSQLVVENCYNPYEIANTNNNSQVWLNCFANEVTNIAWRFNGTGTNCTMIACEAGGRQGNGAKALVVTTGIVTWRGGNLEDFSGLRATDAADTHPGIIEVGINGAVNLTDVTFLTGSYPTALPIAFRQFNSGGHVTRCRQLGFTAGLPMVKAYRAYSDRLRFVQAPGASSTSSGPVYMYADHAYTGTPAILKEISCTLYHPSDIPAASQVRAGEVFATYDDGGATRELRYVVQKSGTGTWENSLLTPNPAAFTLIGGTSGALAVNTVYHSNDDSTRTQRLLPLAATPGDEITMVVYGAAGTRINQNAAAGTIMLPNGTQSTGSAAGYMTAEKGASFVLRCMFASGGGYWQVTKASGTFAVF